MLKKKFCYMLECTTNTDCTGIVSFCIEQMESETLEEPQVTEPSKASGTQEVTVTKTPVTPSSATSAYAAEFLKFVGVLYFMLLQFWHCIDQLSRKNVWYYFPLSVSSLYEN